MSRLNDTLYYYAEITIEASSPLVLASGKNGNFFDVELVRDANGLPAIPGSTIAGILRHAVQNSNGEDFTNLLFGSMDKNAERNSSALEVSWAYVHDSNNCFHKSFYSSSSIEGDSILKELYITDNPVFKRDHVSINDKGSASDAGKFDRYFVPAGTRFTFSIGLWSAKETDAWNKILGIFSSPTFRLGAAGRDGYGKIKVVEVKVPASLYYDLSKEEDLKNFRKCTKKYDLSKSIDNTEKYELKLNFPLGFRIGGGSKSFLKNQKHPADMLPYSERVIKWTDNQGTFVFEPELVIPASAIKGALRHRAAFHLARLENKWTSSDKSEGDGLSELFGFAANNSDECGKAGKIWFTDIYLDKAETYELARNSIDRFTGGTMKSALFQEENVSYGKTFTTEIYIDNQINKESNVFKAFKWALDDLASGRLAIGGGSGHGLGFNHAGEME